MQRVTASQVSFSNDIGEPGHTKPRPRDYATALAARALFVVCALLSTATVGL